MESRQILGTLSTDFYFVALEQKTLAYAFILFIFIMFGRKSKHIFFGIQIFFKDVRHKKLPNYYYFFNTQ